MDGQYNPSPMIRFDQELRRDLASGERVLWQGNPDPKYLNHAFGMWLFAIPWTTFSIAWTGIALAAYLTSFGRSNVAGAPWWGWVAPLFGTPFIAVGAWMLYQPFKARRDAGHTLHALTDTRLISLTLGKVRTVKYVALDKLGPVTVRERANGWGDLSVETGSTTDSDGDRRTDRFEITGVPDIARLHRLLNEQRRPAM